VDDFVILDTSKEKLESYKTEIGRFLQMIKLELHPEKSKIYPLHKGVKLLGFRVFYKYKLPYKRNIRRFLNRFDMILEDYKNGKLSSEDVKNKVNGWNAYAMHGNTYKLRKRLMGELKCLN